MKYYAKLSSRGIVVEVYTFENNTSVKEAAEVMETTIDRVQESVTRETSSHPANIGYKYDRVYQEFLEPQPYTSWALNTVTLFWEAPVPYPDTRDINDNPELYHWDESQINWIKS